MIADDVRQKQIDCPSLSLFPGLMTVLIALVSCLCIERRSKEKATARSSPGKGEGEEKTLQL